MMPLDLNVSASHSYSSGVQGGDSVFGDLIVGGGKNDIPVVIWYVVGAAVLLFLWLKLRK